ncbi:MAG: thioredoxin-dependent thiol peroxidase [Gammaproteobacteria bacterium]
MLTVGKPAPSFNLANQDNQFFSLNDFRGKNVVIYFYPKDDTPGCTREACDFRDQIKDFTNTNSAVIGISKDNVTSHQKFKQKYNLPFTLLSDTSGEICEAYGVLVEKKRFGKKYRGINRSTFLIDENGVLRAIWQDVKVDGHVSDILNKLNLSSK